MIKSGVNQRQQSLKDMVKRSKLKTFFFFLQKRQDKSSVKARDLLLFCD